MHASKVSLLVFLDKTKRILFSGHLHSDNCLTFFTVHPVINNTYPLGELKSLSKIRGDIDVELVAELLSELSDLKGHSWVSEIWAKSGLDWINFTDDKRKIEEIIKNYVRINHYLYLSIYIYYIILSHQLVLLDI